LIKFKADLCAVSFLFDFMDYNDGVRDSYSYAAKKLVALFLGSGLPVVNLMS
jgi:hypothetical protein